MCLSSVFSVWGSPMLCGGCHLRLANLESSRSAVRWGTCGSLTSLGLHNSGSYCLIGPHPFSSLLTYMTILDSNFLSIYTFSNGVMVIVKFVPFVPLMAQVAETHIDTQKSLQNKLKIPYLFTKYCLKVARANF